MVVAGLLFLAFAYLAVGQAAANRNGAQTAADAAALAAAQETRDRLAGDWLAVLRDPAKWEDILVGDTAVFDGCPRAGDLAARNDATVLSCGPAGLLGYKVDVETNKTVGDSVVPGTESIRSSASATAVIDALCTFDPPREDAGAGEEPLPLPQLTCDDVTWNPDPGDPTTLPEAKDLFDVHLSD
ncbi:secreted protein [Streptomyces zinciresistens K42]|uniref:Secreted protein n=1 Tax=Streptomyces zinciresistens K42 TaxID=700597 RepID=G2GI95_9ACTN|nr:secreted protein [Streptomyces zinciresistens K42]